ncbi:MAG: hypothetical protein KF888_07980 [Nitrosomonas sp.]|nr:hypothetical protein [Nitrosomonas sp.]
MLHIIRRMTGSGNPSLNGHKPVYGIVPRRPAIFRSDTVNSGSPAPVHSPGISEKVS